MAIAVVSDALDGAGSLFRRYTGQGEDVSPPLRWSQVPQGVKQLAVLMEEEVHNGHEPWTHWLLYNVPPNVRSLPEAVGPEAQPGRPTRAAHGKNSWGSYGYGGPMPPAGQGPRRYHIRLLALDVEMSLEPGLTREQFFQAVRGRIRDEGQLLCRYQRD